MLGQYPLSLLRESRDARLTRETGTRFKVLYAEFELREHGSRNIDSGYWALIFFMLAVLAGWLGFFGLAGLAAGIAKALFLIFLVLWF